MSAYKNSPKLCLLLLSSELDQTLPKLLVLGQRIRLAPPPTQTIVDLVSVSKHKQYSLRAGNK